MSAVTIARWGFQTDPKSDQALAPKAQRDGDVSVTDRGTSTSKKCVWPWRTVLSGLPSRMATLPTIIEQEFFFP